MTINPAAPDPQGPPTAGNAATDHPLPRASIVVAALSTVVEWYDFTLYLFMATVLSRVFFGDGPESILTTLAVFAIAYVMRPIGALVFGYFGDRLGRRPVLLASMTVMTAAMLATALLPTQTQIGPTAGVLLLLFRCVMGFSVGGEYTGVMTYLVEGAVPGRRGLVASLAAAASEIGGLLAAGVSALTVFFVSGDALEEWGWRIPFLVGAVLAALTLAARSIMQESPAFEQLRKSGSAPSRPLSSILRFHRPALYRTFAISALASVTYYVGITYVPVFLSTVTGYDERWSLGLTTIASVAVVAVTPIAGALTDRFGRRPTLIVLGALAVALPVTMFGLMAHGSLALALTGAVTLACIAGGLSAVGASATPEQLPVAGRLSGLAVGTVATTIFGGLTPYLSQALVQDSGSAIVPGAMVAAVALLALPVLWRMPETAPGFLAPGLPSVFTFCETTPTGCCPDRGRRPQSRGVRCPCR
ncbi:MFS transporter [Rhodococcus sp. JS3073]|uniref:MFS transporter n=1 Tax=Rhodococcus sp. JS3073 TaxID=3002901 RepID=UPI002286161C|nr:MFS transporter [Rhodococcus sp. JS3073]WAM11933.1 MFS transporter [Rhodococcus sp. JS3073]